MAGSVTEIVNRALDLIGQDPIGSIDDDTRTAGLCARTYPPLRDAVLRLHPWNFALVRASLPALTSAPAWGFRYAYQLPAACVRLIRLNIADPRTPYQVESGQLLTDVSPPLGVLYVRRVEEPASFDPLFETVLAYALARDLARTIANSGAMREDMAKSFEAALREARGVDAVECAAQDLWSDDLLLARL